MLNTENLKQILKCNQLEVRDEISVLTAIADWVQAFPKRYILVLLYSIPLNNYFRIENLSFLLQHVRFAFIPAKDLVAIPTSHPIIGQCSTFAAHLQEALITQVLPSFFSSLPIPLLIIFLLRCRMQERGQQERAAKRS